jgi:Domain of unknown function (DUF4267)
MKSKELNWTYFILSLLLGAGLLFIGGRFLLAPEASEQGFGINIPEQGFYGLHYVKGIRDIFSGLIIIIFTLLRRRLELAILLGVGALVPLVDFLIVRNASPSNITAQLIHSITASFLIVLAFLIWRQSNSN